MDPRLYTYIFPFLDQTVQNIFDNQGTNESEDREAFKLRSVLKPVTRRYKILSFSHKREAVDFNHPTGM